MKIDELVEYCNEEIQEKASEEICIDWLSITRNRDII
jgi:hypothetical protein